MNIPAINFKDGYKLDHRRQYPENTVKIYANFTPRKSRMQGVDSVVFFGLTYFIKDFLIEEFNKTFFSQPKEKALAKYKRRVDNYLGKHGITFEHIEALHDLGYVPVRIKALPEGALVKCGVPVLTITNTLPEFFWVPNFLETIISTELWGMSTSATIAFNYRLLFDSWAMKTAGNTAFSSTFQAHDFSARGLYGRHAGAMSGAAHLTAFRGSDTLYAVDFLEEYYGADSDTELVAASVAATEHSVMCMGMSEGEQETFRRLIQDVYPEGIVSIVSDTWDLWKVLTQYLPNLKAQVMERDGKVVIRPDSGDPAHILTGYTEGEVYHQDGKIYLSGTEQSISEAEFKGVVQLLWEEFGGTTNELGYKELDSHIGTIYGDSITLTRADDICSRLAAKKFASTNWVAGVGSFTYQYNTRDTFGWAMKATYGELKHESGYDFTGQPQAGYIEAREIFKDPITDDGTKKSARGLLRVELENGVYVLYDRQTKKQEQQGELKIVFEDGELIKDTTLAEVRALVESNIASKLLVAA